MLCSHLDNMLPMLFITNDYFCAKDSHELKKKSYLVYIWGGAEIFDDVSAK